MKKLMKPNVITNRTFWLMLGWLVVAMPANGFYDPSLGRWINRDPIGDVASLVHVIPFIEPAGSEDNHAWELQIAEVSNLSLFVLNDPVNWLDLNGEAGIKIPKFKPKPKPTTPSNPNASCFNPKCPVGSKKNPINVPPGTNPPGNIGGRGYSGHALDRMQGRGIYPSAVENAVKNGKSCPATLKGRTRHYDKDNDMTVYTDDTTGRVITVLFGEGGL
jgi:hypothetical protein